MCVCVCVFFPHLKGNVDFVVVSYATWWLVDSEWIGNVRGIRLPVVSIILQFAVTLLI